MATIEHHEPAGAEGDEHGVPPQRGLAMPLTNAGYDVSFVSQPIGVPSQFTAASVIELDLAHPLPAAASTDDTRDVLVVARLCGTRVGMVVCSSRVAADPDALSAAIETTLGIAITVEAESHGLTAVPRITAARLVHHDLPHPRGT
jgi:hypothetical protein